MSTILNYNSQPNTTQTQSAAACEQCQKGNCCGSCWCCIFRDKLATPPQLVTIAALLAAAGDVGCDWLSSAGPRDKFIDLSEVCGGSGYYGRVN